MENRNRHLAAEVGSLLVFALSVFSFFALVTYHPADPSFLSNADGAAQNACGRIGAYLSSLVLQCFGVGGFLVPAALFFLSATIHKREGVSRFFGIVGGMAVAVMALTVFLSLQWKYWPYAGSLLMTGGVFGVWMAEILNQQFNPLGASIVSLLVFCLAIVLSTPVSLAKWGAWMLARGSAISWRMAKFGGTYLFYLSTVAAMRGAHAAGDLLQKLIEGAIKRARERAAIARAVKEVIAEPVVPALPAALEADLVEAAASVIPSQDEPELPEEEEESDEEVDVIEVSSIKKAIAPSDSSSEPAILPPEPAKASEEKAASRASKAAQRRRFGQWKLPTLEFLKNPPKVESAIDRERLIQNSQILKQKFADFGIEGDVTAVRPGPVITLYEYKPGPGVKVSRIASLADDLSMALSAQSVRILAPLPGKAVVGIEIPNETREKVLLREFLQHQDFAEQKHLIPVVMGKDIGGQPFLSDLARMPHLLCAGQTGSGKSVFMNGLICSLLYRFTPDELRLILVDPKFIEFRSYQDIPHLLLPVVDDPGQASIALKWAVREMERRYRILAAMGARNLAGFNQKVDEMGAEVVRDVLFSEENQQESFANMSGGDWHECFEPDEIGTPKVGKLPYIVVIIDELADLMMVAKKEVEISIARIAQKARAAGIHLVIATQRPSTDVITGLIKANLPSRASFQLASFVDSKTILDRAGAERLLGQGDMLFIPPGVSNLIRLQGAYVDDDEIGKITSFLRAQGKPAYRDEILVDESASGANEDGDDELDALFDEAVELVKRSGHASASFIQRHLKVGYNRAARMIETMESRGLVGPADGAKPREILMRQ